MKYILLIGMLFISACSDNPSVLISSNPGGATIFLDGEEIGETPSESGEYVSIELPEFQNDYKVELIKENDVHKFSETELVYAMEGREIKWSVRLRKSDSSKVIASKLQKAKDERQARREKIDANPAIEPKMVKIPEGSYIAECAWCPSFDKTKKLIKLKAFSIGSYEVTHAEWDRCVVHGACEEADDESWGKGAMPVINVNDESALKYVAWLNIQTNKSYRLASESEWEYISSIQQQECFSSTLNNIKPADNRISGSYVGEKFNADVYCPDANDNRHQNTMPVGSYPPNNLGIYDFNGNVSEIVADCRDSNIISYIRDMPNDGSPHLGNHNCSGKAVKGNNWESYARHPSTRNSGQFRQNYIGFRLAHDQ